MTSRWVLLAPFAALAFVGVLLAATFALATSPQSEANHPRLASTAAAAEATPGTLTQSVDPSVCSSPSRRPALDAPRVFNPVYTQRAEAAGITIVANADVNPEALDIAVETLTDMFAENDLETPLAAEGAYIIIADEDQGILEIPEFACLEESDRSFQHVCGIADHADYPVATVNELDLLGRRNGPCGGLNILYHEVGHLVQGWAIGPADAIDIRLLYQDALNAGKYERAYAATNANEYFAEGTQAYFLRGSGGEDRDTLRDYDPDLFAMLQSIYTPGA